MRTSMELISLEMVSFERYMASVAALKRPIRLDISSFKEVYEWAICV